MYWCNFLAHHSPIHSWLYIPLNTGENRAVKEHKQCFLISWLVFQLFWKKKLIFGVNLRFRRLRFCLCKEQRQHRGHNAHCGVLSQAGGMTGFFSKSFLICSCKLSHQSTRTSWRPWRQWISTITWQQLVVPPAFAAHLGGMENLLSYHGITWGNTGASCFRSDVSKVSGIKSSNAEEILSDCVVWWDGKMLS